MGNQHGPLTNHVIRYCYLIFSYDHYFNRDVGALKAYTYYISETQPIFISADECTELFAESNRAQLLKKALNIIIT